MEKDVYLIGRINLMRKYAKDARNGVHVAWNERNLRWLFEELDEEYDFTKLQPKEEQIIDKPSTEREL